MTLRIALDIFRTTFALFIDAISLPIAPVVLKSGSLNLLEPSGSLQVCNGIAFYTIVY
jgi:hypothetical protein